MANLSFYKINSAQEAASFLAKKLKKVLIGKKRLLWMVPGGSGMVVAALAARMISDVNTNRLIIVTLTDERYGPVGHNDSNWKQLRYSGFRLPGSVSIPVLCNKTLGNTVAAYREILLDSLNTSDYSIALAGLGADGHIFGIKPNSPAVAGQDEADGYEWDDYTRITPTIKFLKKLDEVVIFAVGPDKHHQLEKLNLKVSADEQPAQLLKDMKKVSILNDRRGIEV